MAEKVIFTDPDGNTISLFKIGDVMVPPLTGLEKCYAEIRDIQAKEDDILLTTYPRAGTHLIWEIVRMLKDGSSDYIKGEKEDEFLEMFHFNGLTNKSQRVINTHVPPEFLPVAMLNGKYKIIHVYRSPKDVMVSLYNHIINLENVFGYKGSFSGFFELAMRGQVESGSWFDFELKYEEFFRAHPEIPYLSVSFEDLKQKPVDTIRKIALFLELLENSELFSAIADATSFNKMKSGKYGLTSEMMKQFFTNEEYSRMYRKGISGDWKNWFTVAQNERFDAEFKRRMKNCSLGIKFE